MKPRVSVITSTFNSDPYLDSFLKCVSAQTINTEIQLIINLSSPTNHELETISKYAQSISDITVIKHGDRIPIYRAWNECLEHVKAPLVAIWNVDDLRTNQSLEKQAEILELGEHSSVTGPFIMTSHYGELEGKLCNFSVEKSDNYFRGMYHGPFFMFRTSCLTKLIGFDEQFKIASDFDFAVRLASVGSVAHCDDVLGYYLNERRGASTSRSSLQPVERDRILLRYGALELINVRDLPDSVFFDATHIYVRDNIFDLGDVCTNLEAIRNLNKGSWNFIYLSQSLPIHLVFMKLLSRVKASFKFRVLKLYKLLGRLRLIQR